MSTAYVHTADERMRSLSAHYLDIELRDGNLVLVNCQEVLPVPASEVLTVEIRPSGLWPLLRRMYYRLAARLGKRRGVYLDIAAISKRPA